MANVGVFVVVIQDSICFVNSQTSTKFGVNPSSIYDITEKEVVGGLVTNTSVIVPREVVSKILYSEVDEEIVIPRIIQGDVKEMFFGEVSIDGSIDSIGGKCCNEFSKDEGFLALGC